MVFYDGGSHFGCSLLLICLFVIATVSVPNHILAQESEVTKEPIEMAGLFIFGSADEVFQRPGSGTFLNYQDIQYQQNDDIHRVLLKVPGVYSRQEDGFGLFPNISLRGVDTTRSSKVTLMEDGILTAPAPYSAPAAYYSPTISRMRGLEVLKGSSQIHYGPHTTGGAINYLSTAIPNRKTTYLKTMAGSFDEVRLHTYFGDTIKTDQGRFGYLLEGYLRRNDGFKTIDKSPGFRDSDDTGFSKTDTMLKLFWEPVSDTYQRLEFKIGYSELDADETYLGLSEKDFKDDPDRRYGASRFDNIKSRHMRTSLRHTIETTDDFTLTSTIYYNRFHRNWFKLKDVSDDTDPAFKNLSKAIAEGGSHLDVLRGEAAGSLRLRNNNRDYKLWGVETIANQQFSTGALDHDLSVGLRYHFDEIRRDQRDETFTQAANGTIISRIVGPPGGGGDRLQETAAWALWGEDTLSFDKWTLVPGIRYEHLRQGFKDFNQGIDLSGSLDVLAAGLGVTYALNPQTTIFGGFYRGFSVPSPRAHLKTKLDEETSHSFELGTRYAHLEGFFNFETTFFITRFEDLIVIDNIGGAGSGDTENAGEVQSTGVEFSLEFDPALANHQDFNNPWFTTLTITNAELRSDSKSTNAESIFSGGKKGNDVPYIPDVLISAGTGLSYKDSFAIYLTGSYVDETFTTASNSSEQLDNDKNPDARFGKTDRSFTLDLSGSYKLNDTTKLIGAIHNLTDRRSIVSRHPHGPRPQKPLTAYVGLEMIF